MKLNRTLHTYKIVLGDFIAAFLAWSVFHLSNLPLFTDFFDILSPAFLIRSLMASSLWVVLYTLFGRYRDIYRLSRLKESVLLAGFSLGGAISIYIAFLFEDPDALEFQPYLKMIGRYFLLHLFFSMIMKVSVLSHLKTLVLKGQVYFNTLVVGSCANARELYDELENNNRHLGLKVIGFVQSEPDQAHSFQQHIPALGSFHKLPEVVQKFDIEEVIIAIEPSEHRLIEQILTSLEGVEARISILPDVYQILLGSVKVHHLLGTPLIEVKRNLLPVWQQLLKRMIDLGAGIAILFFLSPLYAFLAIIVKITSAGPVLFKQERIGMQGKPFYIYKFRSMYLDSEKMGPALSSDEDPRVTRFGRFMRKVRLDELPQFYNVLIGDMSLVGPRPERQHFINLITQYAPHYKHLHRVRPGITSLGQVKFGYAQNVEEMVRRLKFDILYIENMSLAMDFRVMLYTIKIIIQGRGK